MDILNALAQFGPRGLVALTMLIVVPVVVFGLMAREADRRGVDLVVDLKALRFEHRKRLDPDQTRELRYQVAMARLEDLEQASVAVVKAPDAELDARLGKWFTYLCENLAEVLSAGSHTRYRVSIWTDDPSNATHLRLLAQHGFDRNDPRMDQVDPITGQLLRNTGYLARERETLLANGWVYDPRLTLWSPGG